MIWYINMLLEKSKSELYRAEVCGAMRKCGIENRNGSCLAVGTSDAAGIVGCSFRGEEALWNPENYEEIEFGEFFGVFNWRLP